jgi:outer membrane protein assembly factor BamB
MSRRIALAGLCLLLWTSAATAQRTVDAKLPTRTATARLGLERQWFTAIPLGNANERVLSFNVDGGLLFVKTTGGNLHTSDAETGRPLWMAHLGPAAARGFDVAVNSTQVIATNLKTIYGLDRATGREVWHATLDDLPSTGTGASEDQAMVGLRSGKIMAFTTHKIEQYQSIPRSAGSFLWAWQSRTELSARPIITDKVVTFGSQDHRVYTATLGSLTVKPRLLYRFLTGGPISANMAIWGNRTIIVPSGDNNVYAIDLFTGTVRWEVATGAPVDQEPLVSGSEVYMINEQGRVMRLDGNQGDVIWDTPTPAHRLLALSPARLYLETEFQDLMILDRATGAVLASPRESHERAGLNLRDFALSFPNYYDDRIYFCSEGGLLVCLREMGRVQPTPLRDPNLPPFGSIPEDGLLSEGDTAETPRDAGSPPRTGPSDTIPSGADPGLPGRP